MRVGWTVLRIQAQFVVIDSKRILPNAQIEICDRRIAQIHESPSVRPDLLLADSVILPGLINSHTHLEFSDLEQPLAAGGSFPEWIERVIQHRMIEAQNLGPAALRHKRRQAIQRGVRECASWGTAWIVDIVTNPWSSGWLNTNELTANNVKFPGFTILPEVLGLSDDRLRQSIEWVHATQLEVTRDHPNCQVGFSPHAPYSLAHWILTERVAVRIDANALVAMHVAESQDERTWLETGSGPFRQFFESRGLPVDAPHIQIGEAIEMLARHPRSLLIHGNYLTSSELDRVAESSIALVYCPRTHEHFGHRAYPLGEMLRRGIPVVLGTDSRASNPDLNLWQECKSALRRHPEWSASSAFESVTSLPAAILGLSHDLGSLDIGKSAWLNKTPTPIGATPENLIELLLRQPSRATLSPLMY